MNKRTIVLFLIVSLLALSVVDPMPRGSLSESYVLNKSRELLEEHKYLAALKVLEAGLNSHQNSRAIQAEFRKDIELYFVHEVSSGYRRVAKNPHDVQAYIQISNAFWLTGQHHRAMEVLVEGLEDNANSPILWKAISRLEIESGRPNEANSAFLEAERQEKAP